MVGIKQIHHIDDDETNNSLDNLEVLTIEEHFNRHKDTRRKLLYKYNKNKMRKILCIETNVIYENKYEAHRKTGISYGNILMVCNGKRKTAGGYHWKYVD